MGGPIDRRGGKLQGIWNETRRASHLPIAGTRQVHRHGVDAVRRQQAELESMDAREILSSQTGELSTPIDMIVRHGNGVR
jgi:hypothetical protein